MKTTVHTSNNSTTPKNVSNENSKSAHLVGRNLNVSKNGENPTNGDDIRCQSLPDRIQDEERSKNNCDINGLTVNSEKSWFKTWPERCDKVKSNENSPTNSPKNSSIIPEKRTKVTLTEALQNISLAYSPVTKQLHLVEIPKCEEFGKNDESEHKKIGHHRTEAGSFSSTISTLSDPSTSGSLLESEEHSLSSFEIYEKCRKRSLTNFLSKHIFSWKPEPNLGNVWKIFSSKAQDENSVSPIHVVASSSALIQHERPSNLPAKTFEEEQRHRDEYKAILAAAKKKDAETNVARQKQQKLQLKLEEQQAMATKHFLQNVLPDWENMWRTKKTHDIWWQGLPSAVRGRVWRHAIGNELNLTAQLYHICAERARHRLTQPEPEPESPESSMDLIRLDISRTFPTLGIFQRGGPYEGCLHSMLAAYVCYRPDVGYVQGMSYIAAILILNMEQHEAFVCFANLLNRPLHLAAFTLNQSQMSAYYAAYDEIFQHNLPKLHAHFVKSRLTPDLYRLDWIYTIYAKAMPLDVACRVWDVFLRDGYEFIFRTALGILHLNQRILLEMDFIRGAQFLTKLPEDLSSDQLFKSIQTVTTAVGKRTFAEIVEKCSCFTNSHEVFT